MNRGTHPLSRISPTRLSVWFAYVVVLATLTHLPKATVGRFPIRIWDKLSHTLAYALLGWLSWWTFATRRATLATGAAQRVSAGRIALGFAALLLLAAADEYTQQWVGRDPSLTDWIANAIGIVIGLGGAMLMRWCRRA
ncbi:MAG: VanZ family protein [Phycisphaerae bacterium]|nr:VanZ family protein [Phycisphaerae bacterium]NUQ47960.1 VanZ family protein [Phycisphaerae bacterium]